MGVKKLGQAAIAVSPGTVLYTTPTGYVTDVVDIAISNTNSTSANITLSIVDAAGSMTTSNHLMSSSTIPANTLVQWTGVQNMAAGDFIKAFGSTTGINVRITGEERRLGT